MKCYTTFLIIQIKKSRKKNIKNDLFFFKIKNKKGKNVLNIVRKFDTYGPIYKPLVLNECDQVRGRNSRLEFS